MLKSERFDIVRYMMVVALFCVVTGCGKNEPPPAENDAPETVPKVAVAEIATAESAVGVTEAETTNKYPKVILPAHLEETKNMPSGMAKSRAVQLKYIEGKLKELQTQLQEDSVAVGEAEKKARFSDPDLGKLYKELVNKQIEYRSALAESETFVAAKESNMETLKMYQMMIERQKILTNKEKSDDKK